MNFELWILIFQFLVNDVSLCTYFWRWMIRLSISLHELSSENYFTFIFFLFSIWWNMFWSSWFLFNKWFFTTVISVETWVWVWLRMYLLNFFLLFFQLLILLFSWIRDCQWSPGDSFLIIFQKSLFFLNFVFQEFWMI